MKRPQVVLLTTAVILALTSHFDSIAKPTATTYRKKLGSVRTRIQDVKHKLAVAKHRQKVVTSQLYRTQRQLNTTRETLGMTRSRLDSATVLLEEIRQQLRAAETKLLAKRRALTSRLTEAYKNPPPTYISAVVTSENAWDAMTRSKLVQHIVSSDVRLVDDIREIRSEIAQREQAQHFAVNKISGLKRTLTSKEFEEKQLATLKQAQLDSIQQDRAEYEKALDDLIAESNRIAARIRALQATPAGKKRLAKAFKGGFIRPVNGSVSSGFGMRFHPILKKYKLHTGVDFRCHVGTPVHAAASGTVIIAGWMGAYGNAVVIDHGGGVSTLYGHNSRVACRIGQEVQRGQVISYSGSTGWSTGPHLHFEVRHNGTPVNPL